MNTCYIQYLIYTIKYCYKNARQKRKNTISPFRFVPKLNTDLCPEYTCHISTAANSTVSESVSLLQSVLPTLTQHVDDLINYNIYRLLVLKGSRLLVTSIRLEMMGVLNLFLILCSKNVPAKYNLRTIFWGGLFSSVAYLPFYKHKFFIIFHCGLF